MKPGIIIAAAALAVVCGCARKDRKVVGMVPKGATQMFWQAAHAGAVKAAREFNLELAWNAPEHESDRSRQVSIVDAMINRRVDGIALSPVDSTALVAVTHRAIDSGIPVVVFDSALESGRTLAYIATDNREAGRMAARRMGARLSGKVKVAVVSDMPGSASTTERVEGFQQELRARYPDFEMLPVQFVMADRARARAVTENLLSANAGLAGIFADHENAAIGCALALRARGNRQLCLVGFDSSDQLVDVLKEGWIDSLVVQNPFRMGYETVRALGLKLSGRVPDKSLDTGSTLVTAGDLEKPEVRALLKPDLATYLGRER